MIKSIPINIAILLLMVIIVIMTIAITTVAAINMIKEARMLSPWLHPRAASPPLAPANSHPSLCQALCPAVRM